MKISIQEGIFLLSTLKEKFNQLCNSLSSYRTPLSVDGKDVSDNELSGQLIVDLETINILNSDIINLKSKLSKLNVDTVNENGISIITILEHNKCLRKQLESLKYLARPANTKVEVGVGVVKYGALQNDVVKDLIYGIETNLNKNSIEVDRLNANTYFDIVLKTEI